MGGLGKALKKVGSFVKKNIKPIAIGAAVVGAVAATVLIPGAGAAVGGALVKGASAIGAVVKAGGTALVKGFAAVKGLAAGGKLGALANTVKGVVSTVSSFTSGAGSAPPEPGRETATPVGVFTKKAQRVANWSQYWDEISETPGFVVQWPGELYQNTPISQNEAKAYADHFDADSQAEYADHYYFVPGETPAGGGGASSPLLLVALAALALS